MSFALPSSKLPLVYRHPYQGFVNILPYIDGELDTKTKIIVDRMIQQEMQNMDPQDYLHELPMPQTKLTDLLKSEMERVQQQQPMPKIDFEQIPNFNQEFQSTHEIQEANQQLNVLNQYAQINIINSELLNKYGKESWALLLKSQENEKNRLSKEVVNQQQELNHINAQRKYEQNEVKYKLDSLKAKVKEVLTNNAQLEVVCGELEQEIYDKQRKKLKLN
ncbi:unnamed protein product [Paramecium primaurelia]|uniref:Uncharacterized protein n=2 Tax=Paramecium TaxID=5884 RepID=A0A8S1UNB0_9CILI|nr:unnamed protein product [Paramecium primaurelia]CAD8165202.1 unnamed protein product [Paramecium pentaurelia]